MIFLIATCAFYFGPLSIAYVAVFDRYFLPVVPMAIALVWQGFNTTVLSAVPGQTFLLRPIGIAAGFLSLLLLLGLLRGGHARLPRLEPGALVGGPASR